MNLLPSKIWFLKKILSVFYIVRYFLIFKQMKSNPTQKKQKTNYNNFYKQSPTYQESAGVGWWSTPACTVRVWAQCFSREMRPCVPASTPPPTAVGWSWPTHRTGANWPEHWPACVVLVHSTKPACQLQRWKQEGNILFNDALNTFYLRLYGVTHMVKDHSDSEKGNPLPPHRLLLSINSKGSFICTIPETG